MATLFSYQLFKKTPGTKYVLMASHKEDTLFYLASISKVFWCVYVLQHCRKSGIDIYARTIPIFITETIAHQLYKELFLNQDIVGFI